MNGFSIRLFLMRTWFRKEHLSFLSTSPSLPNGVYNTMKKLKKPWSTKAAMEQVYAQGLWGSNQTGFYSGEGSHKPKLVGPYLNAVSTFLNSFTNPPVICDLGCGDFNIGKELVKYSQKYIAVDIVPDLIAFNKKQFLHPHLKFLCLDIAKDDLPFGDCVLLRQVLQHLSNAEVHAVLAKLSQFKYFVLTEHLPQGDFVPNKDIISGQGIRLKKKSGIQLAQAPFYLKAASERELVSVPLDKGKGVIVTTLYQLF